MDEMGRPKRFPNALPSAGSSPSPLLVGAIEGMEDSWFDGADGLIDGRPAREICCWERILRADDRAGNRDCTLLKTGDGTAEKPEDSSSEGALSVRLGCANRFCRGELSPGTSCGTLFSED